MLDVRRVTAAYGGPPVLWEISLEVAPGEVVALLGANGAGKTTLLRVISGLLHPSAGICTFEGHEIHRLAAHRVAGLGLLHVPEGRQLWTDMTVAENLALGAYPKAARRERAETEAWVGALFPRLGERARQLAGTLSGGEQQMLAIGRSLMGRPRLLLLDEPSVGLAPRVVEDLFGAITAIARRGVAILLVEQNARRALDVASRGYVLEAGRCRLEGPREALVANPYVQGGFLR